MKSKESIHMMGNVYSAAECSGRYLLTSFFIERMGCYAMLVDIKSGNRWNDPVKVEDMINITKTEFEKVANTKTMFIVKKSPLKKYQNIPVKL